MLDNIILMTDGYKPSHWAQYPPGTQLVHSYQESRGGEFPETTFFGLQYYLKRYMEGRVVDKIKIDQAQARLDKYIGPGIFYRAGWEHIAKDHYGHLPLHIKAVDEGRSFIDHTPLMAVENTCPQCSWLPSYMETVLSMPWYPSTVASKSRTIKKVIRNHLLRTGDEKSLLWKLHDFGFRGVSSPESAAIGGAAHLINFMGSDTIAGIEMLDEYYGSRTAVIAGTIPASEHSTITAWTRAGEAAAYANMLEKYPTGVFACVSDSYDLRKAVSDMWGNKLRRAVLSRDGTVVIRPDSGEPVDMVLQTVRGLEEKFGTETNDKGFKVLNPHVRVIQGDGMSNVDDIDALYTALANYGYSADNLTIGMGGGLLQQVNRDTQKFAIKASYIERLTNDGEVEKYGISKSPVNAPWKRSREGRQFTGAMRTVFKDGILTEHFNLDIVRANAGLW